MAAGQHEGHSHTLRILIAAQHRLPVEETQLYSHRLRDLSQTGGFHARATGIAGSRCKWDDNMVAYRIIISFISQETIDVAASCAFAVGLAAFNMLVYLFPMPRCVRQKFKD